MISRAALDGLLIVSFALALGMIVRGVTVRQPLPGVGELATLAPPEEVEGRLVVSLPREGDPLEAYLQEACRPPCALPGDLRAPSASELAGALETAGLCVTHLALWEKASERGPLALVSLEGRVTLFLGRALGQALVYDPAYGLTIWDGASFQRLTGGTGLQAGPCPVRERSPRSTDPPS